MKTLLMFVTFLSMPALAISLKCKINSSVDGAATVTKNIEIPLIDEKDPADCLKQESYDIPGTMVEVNVYGHGACNPNPDMCTNSEPTVGGIQIHEKKNGEYSHSYSSCNRKPVDSSFLQHIVHGDQKVNVVAGCELD